MPRRNFSRNSLPAAAVHPVAPDRVLRVSFVSTHVLEAENVVEPTVRREAVERADIEPLPQVRADGVVTADQPRARQWTHITIVSLSADEAELSGEVRSPHGASVT